MKASELASLIGLERKKSYTNFSFIVEDILEKPISDAEKIAELTKSVKDLKEAFVEDLGESLYMQERSDFRYHVLKKDEERW